MSVAAAVALALAVALAAIATGSGAPSWLRWLWAAGLAGGLGAWLGLAAAIERRWSGAAAQLASGLAGVLALLAPLLLADRPAGVPPDGPLDPLLGAGTLLALAGGLHALVQAQRALVSGRRQVAFGGAALLAATLAALGPSARAVDVPFPGLVGAAAVLLAAALLLALRRP